MSLDHMQVVRPYGGHAVTFRAIPGGPGGPRGSWVPQWATRSRRALMEEGKCKGRPSAAPLSRHLPRFPAPQHVPPHSLEPTGGPGSPFLPGRPGPSPPVTAPGSPCRDREQRAGFWQREPRGGRSPDRRPSYSSRCRRPCGVWPAAPLLPPCPFHLPAPPLGLEVLALPEDKAEQRTMLGLR